MARRPLPPDEERRRLFRRMEWIFVYAPPLLAVLIAGFGSAFLAWVVPMPGLGFWGRWAAGVGLILGLPAIAYAVYSWWTRR